MDKQRKSSKIVEKANKEHFKTVEKLKSAETRAAVSMRLYLLHFVKVLMGLLGIARSLGSGTGKY